MIVVSKLYNNCIVKVQKLYAIDIHCFHIDSVCKNARNPLDEISGLQEPASSPALGTREMDCYSDI